MKDLTRFIFVMFSGILLIGGAILLSFSLENILNNLFDFGISLSSITVGFVCIVVVSNID